MGAAATPLFIFGQTLGMVGSGVSAYGQLEQGEAEQKAMQENARLARREAGEAQKRAAEQAGLARMEGSRVIAAQKAAIGASGVDVGTGSAVQLMADSRVQAELDALTARANGLREYYGIKQQATMMEAQGRRVKLASERSAIGTLLGSAGNTAGASAGYKWS